MNIRKGWLSTAAFGAVAAALLSLSTFPVAEQPAYAQTAGPPPGTPTGYTIPGTEITPISNGIVAYIPSANGIVDLPTQAGESIRVDVRDVAAPLTVQFQQTPAGLLAFDAQGNQLTVTELSAGLYLVSQPS